MKKTGAQIVAECLIEQGVDTVFGYPGGQIINVYDALYEYSDKIKHVITAHEQGAAHAADGYARVSGRTGVVIATSGPGATNLVTGLATAFMDSVPLVAITGNVSSTLLGKDSFQEVDIFGVTMPITKHNFIVKKVDELADTLRRAFYIAGEGRKGPVLVDILKDVQMAQAEFVPVPPKKAEPAVSRLRQENIEAAAELINQSKRPFIFAGGGVVSANASNELVEFAKKINAPVSLSLMGLGAYPSDDRYFTGMLGMHGSRISAAAVKRCDLLIVAGARFSDRVIGKAAEFAKDAKILHIDIDAAEIDKNIISCCSVVGDVREVLNKLLPLCKKAGRQAWLAEIDEIRKSCPPAPDPGDVITPGYLLDKVAASVPEDSIIVTDVGQHQMWTAQNYPFKKPRTLITSGGLGTMGYGLGAAIGSKVAAPDKRVVLFTGDGSFHMNCNELITASMNRLPIIIIIMNNGVLGMVRQWQKLMFGKRYSQTTLNRKTNYVMLAEAYGGSGFNATSREEFEAALKKALDIEGPVVINAVIDKDENVLPMVAPGNSYDNQLLSIED